MQANRQSAVIIGGQFPLYRRKQTLLSAITSLNAHPCGISGAFFYAARRVQAARSLSATVKSG
jgi:hypothetical protein